MADLTRAVAFRGIALNTTTLTNGVIVGCLVDTIDYSEVEIRQFTEPFALVDGLDVGGTWLGGRHVRITGTVYDETRGKTFDRLHNLAAVMLAASGTFGYYPLTFYTIGVAGAVQHTINVRPNGLRWVSNRDQFGGKDTDPLAIPWSVTMLAANPAIG